MPVSWTFADVKRHALGVILIVALFAAVLALDPLKWTNSASPIRSVEMVDATVNSGQGEGQYIHYLLFLGDGSTVLVSDDRPRLMGSTVKLERVTRENGFVFYRFPDERRPADVFPEPKRQPLKILNTMY
ncbi:hypothetical protein AJ88_14460 [Mesorhizobium amorphae CCBAU 01583]|nr:hypothetical protein AJ88_14460 [Mesorhizobium amorphae CCBAU 01583]